MTSPTANLKPKTKKIYFQSRLQDFPNP